MNCPAKTEPILPDGHNQSPNQLCSDLTTRSDLGRVANARLRRKHRLSDPEETLDAETIAPLASTEVREKAKPNTGDGAESQKEQANKDSKIEQNVQAMADINPSPQRPVWKGWLTNVFRVLRTYTKFIGPGFMVAVVSIHCGSFCISRYINQKM